MINILWELPGFFFESILHIFLYMQLLSLNIRSIKHPFILMVSYSILGVFFDYIFPIPLGNIIFVLTSIFVIFPYAFKISISENITIYAINSIIINSAADLLITTMPISTNTLNSLSVQVIGELLLFAIFFILFNIINLNKIYIYVIQSSLTIKIMILLIFLLINAEVIIGKIHTIESLKSLPIVLASIIITAVLCIIVIFQTHRLDIRTRDLENYHSYQPMLENLIEDILARQHDFNNQLQAIRMLPYSYTSYDSLSNEIQNYSAHIASEFQNTELLKINLKVLAGFIYNKVSLTAKAGKQLDIKIKNNELTTVIPEYELIRIAGILIDNTVEATPKGHVAYLNLDSKDNKIIITTLNEGPTITDDFQRKVFQKGYTTKSNDENQKHGYGLSNLMKLSEQYNGEVLLDNVEINGQTYIRFEVVI